jgi:hypothetical protein
VENCKLYYSGEPAYLTAASGMEQQIAELFRDPVTKEDKDREGGGGGGGRQSRGGEGGQD